MKTKIAIWIINKSPNWLFDLLPCNLIYWANKRNQDAYQGRRFPA